MSGVARVDVPMIGRLAELRGRVSSHWLASAIACAYLLVSVVLGVAVLTVPKPAETAAAPAASTPTTESGTSVPTTADDSRSHGGASSTTTVPHPTSLAAPPTPPAPPGFRWVSGPGGIRTVIPTGWRTTRSTGPGSMQATDPADPGRFVKFGGSAAPTLGIESLHVQYENDFALRENNYQRLVLESASYGGHDAVQWEFEHRDGAGVSHVGSLYWRANGKEYFILASAPISEWAQMKPIYDVMVANADP
jgi:hypothetical protein